jgi:predicted nucleotidyltransferase
MGQMDLARPITTVVPTLDGPVLQTLARTTQPLTGRQVHRIAGSGSEAGVRKVLVRLETQGVVHATRSGRALVYVANRDHIVWPAIEILTRIREILLERLRAELASWPLGPISAALFGSAARGEGTVGSDVDLLVVSSAGVGATAADQDQWQDQLDSLREHVTMWTGNRCQIYELDVEELDTHVHQRERIVSEWRRDAITLYGEPIGRLIAKAIAGGHR